MKRLAGLLLLFIVVAVSATAQTVTVIRNVNLRPEPSVGKTHSPCSSPLPS